MMTWKPYYSEGFAAGWRELKLVNIHLRLATDRDIERLRPLIEASVRGLQAGDYSPEQLEGALAAVYGVDSQLIADGTYFVAQCEGEIVACGGWSKRRTLCGGDQYAGREDSLLNPKTEAAKIRAFFVGKARHWQLNPGRLRICGESRRISSPRNGGDVERRRVL